MDRNCSTRTQEEEMLLTCLEIVHRKLSHGSQTHHPSIITPHEPGLAAKHTTRNQKSTVTELNVVFQLI